MTLFAVYTTSEDGKELLLGREDKICPLFMERVDAIKMMSKAVVIFGEKLDDKNLPIDERKKLEQALKTIEVKRVIVNEYKES